MAQQNCCVICCAHTVLSKKNGGKPDAKWVYAVFSSAAHRLTGKRTNPHLVRDMIVTFLRDTNVRSPLPAIVRHC